MKNPPQLSHRYVETGTGILVPPGYRRPSDEIARRQSELKTRSFSKVCNDGFAYGMRLERDPETLVVPWAAKGSGLDDLVNQSLADGTIANVGISPVLFAQLTGLIRRRQNQVLGATIVVIGRSTSAKLISNVISRWNAAPLGAVDGLRKIVYQLDTFATAVAETRAYIDRELITIPVVTPDTTQDDARAGTDEEGGAAPQADKLDASSTISGNDPVPNIIESFS